MSIQLIVDPQCPGVPWDAFRGPYLIALDGYVTDGPRYDEVGPRANFNHHEGVDRLATRATCAQVLIAIRQGLLSTFCQDSLPHASVYVNDCDEDVCTSTFALRFSYLVGPTMNPLFNRLVGMEEVLDATAGAYPFPSDLPALQELNWVFSPYRRFRNVGGLESARTEHAFRGVIKDVHERMMAHITGRGGSTPLNLSYRVIERGRDRSWCMVEETGEHARTGMFADGIQAYIAVRSRPDGRHTYTIGRMSKFVPFDVPLLLHWLSKEDDHPWGGGDTIGGSHRVLGSKLAFNQVVEIVDAVIESAAEARRAASTPVNAIGQPPEM